MSNTKTTGGKVFDIINVFILALLVVATVYPVLYVLFASMSDPVKLYAGSRLVLFPRGFSLAPYRIVITNQMIWVSYRNSIIYTLTGTTLSLFITTMAGYVLSRQYLPGRGMIMVIITFTMFFTGGMIPLYLLVRSLKLLDTMWSLVFTGAVSTYNLILMKTYFLSIPFEMEESARIDGANDWVILWRVMAPLAMPVIAVITLYLIVANWNSYIPPSIYIRKRTLFPLQVILREILLSGSNETSLNVNSSDSGGLGDFQAYSESVKYSTIVVSILPIMCIYPALQKYFVKGVMLGAVKG